MIRFLALVFITVGTLVRASSGIEDKPRWAMTDVVEAMKKGTKAELSDPNLLLKLSLKSANQTYQGRKLYVVTDVEKGSVFERSGFKVGDKVSQ